MKITILQRNIEWANPQANIARADEAISIRQTAYRFVRPCYIGLWIGPFYISL